jgi:hypothetical protein
MDAAPQHKIPSTIAELIAAAVESMPVGSGSQAHVYNFPGTIPGLEDYVLRVPRNITLTKQLLEHTTLVPVSHLVRGINIGQPIMGLNHLGITIHLKQHGHALRNLENEARLRAQDMDSIAIESLCSHMEEILSLQGKRGVKNPFTPILTQVYQLGALGYFQDLQFRNILLDEDNGRLNLVDQVAFRNKVSYPGRPEGKLELDRGIHRLLKQLDELHPLVDVDDPNAQRFYNAITRLKSLITNAHTDVLKYPPDLNAVGFANVTGTYAISIDEKATALSGHLAAVLKNSEILRH